MKYNYEEYWNAEKFNIDGRKEYYDNLPEYEKIHYTPINDIKKRH